MPLPTAVDRRAEALLTIRQFSLVGHNDDDHLIGQDVWAPLLDAGSDEFFARGRVQDVTANNATINFGARGVHSFPLTLCRNVNVGLIPAATNDLSRLAHINDAAVLDVLRQRYCQDLIYTQAGQLLVAINPFRNIPALYGEETLLSYMKSESASSSPHPFAVAHKALSALHGPRRMSQSCIISGESGAGKTETARQLMNFFSYSPGVSNKESNNSSVQSIILSSNPLLESLGNAKTLRNNNSSRFGRFVKISVLKGAGITAGGINEYMLEISRIAHQGKGERNFHIFYQTVSHLPSDIGEACRLRPKEFYDYLNKSETWTSDGIDDNVEARVVLRILRSLLPNDQVLGFYKVLSAVLLAGNVTFAPDSKDAARVISAVEFTDLANLLGVPLHDFEQAILTKKSQVQRQWLIQPRTVPQASDVIATVSKEIYAAIFSWVIKVINDRIAPPDHGLESNWIGILDIYGFEYFDTNSLEQFLINFANERLQQFFVEHVFATLQREYREEGIDGVTLTYHDNQEVIDLLQGRTSILGLLEEQCLLGNGNSAKFTAACHAQLQKHPKYRQPRVSASDLFTVLHTAAQVTYNTEDFVLKNRNKMPSDVCDLLRSSSNPVVRLATQLFPDIDPARMRGNFVTSKFAKSLGQLLDILRTSEPHFIRCIKPNEEKVAKKFSEVQVLAQLHSLSILEAIAISHAYKAKFDNFLQEHSLLVELHVPGREKMEPRDAVNAVLKRVDIRSEEFRLGRSMVFIGKEGWMELEKARRAVTRNLRPLLMRLQAAWQCKEAARTFHKLRASLIRFQNIARRYPLARAAAGKHRLRKLFHGAVSIMRLASVKCRASKAAVTIQRHTRGLLVRRKYADVIRKVKQVKLDAALRQWIHAFLTSRRFKIVLLRVRRLRAAKCIQRHWRRYRDASFAKRYRQYVRLDNAARRIQRAWRNRVRRQKKRFQRLLGPFAVPIQRIWRGYWTRKQYDTPAIQQRRRRLVSLMSESRCRLQLTSACRAYIVRTRINDLVQASLDLQAAALAKLSRRRAKATQTAAIRIQAWWRGQQLRRIVKEEKLDFLRGIKLYKIKELESREAADLLAWAKLLRSRHNTLGLQPLQIHFDVAFDNCYRHGWVRAMMEISSRLDSGQSGLLSVAAGAYHTVAYTDSNSLYAFGLNDRGQCGTNCRPQQEEDTAVPRAPIRFPHAITIKQISCGGDYTLVLATNGHIYSFGDNRRGQCGCRPSQPIVAEPSLVNLPHSVSCTYLSAGTCHAGAVDSERRLWMWGAFDHTGLREVRREDLRLPLCVSDYQHGLPSFCRVECGTAITCSLSEHGDMYMSHSGRHNRLAIPPDADFSPVAIPAKIVDYSVSPNSGIIAADAGGTVWQWGKVRVWHPCAAQAINVVLTAPYRLQSTALQSHAFHEVHLGWTDAVAVTDTGRVVGWSIFHKMSPTAFEPHVYTFDLSHKQLVNRVNVVSAPSHTVVLAEMHPGAAAPRST